MSTKNEIEWMEHTKCKTPIQAASLIVDFNNLVDDLRSRIEQLEAENERLRKMFVSPNKPGTMEEFLESVNKFERESKDVKIKIGETK